MQKEDSCAAESIRYVLLLYEHVQEQRANDDLRLVCHVNTLYNEIKVKTQVGVVSIGLLRHEALILKCSFRHGREKVQKVPLHCNY
jgi:predicted component of viral defense system (DUF524 family)